MGQKWEKNSKKLPKKGLENARGLKMSKKYAEKGHKTLNNSPIFNFRHAFCRKFKVLQLCFSHFFDLTDLKGVKMQKWSFFAIFGHLSAKGFYMRVKNMKNFGEDNFFQFFQGCH